MQVGEDEPVDGGHPVAVPGRQPRDLLDLARGAGRTDRSAVEAAHRELRLDDQAVSRRLDRERGPHVGEFDLEYVEKIYATLDGEDIFEERGISRDGAVVVVRPDQYVSGVFGLDEVDRLNAFFAGVLLDAN